jgi:hypothetical protein
MNEYERISLAVYFVINVHSVDFDCGHVFSSIVTRGFTKITVFLKEILGSGGAWNAPYECAVR